MRTARWIIPAVAALAVVVVLAVLFGLRGGSSDVGTTAPSPAPTVPVSPGGPVTTLPDPQRVTIAGYTTHGTTLTLSYAVGIAKCYGTVDTPQVRETSTSVTVTLRLIPPKHRKQQICPDLAKVSSVDVTLSSPLGARAVLDGGRGGAPVPEGTPLVGGTPVR